MKKIFAITIITAAFATNADGQCNNNLKIQSPVSRKPADAATAFVNCNSVTVQWRGITKQNYELTVNIKNAVSNKNIMSKEYKYSGNLYTATFPVTPGNKISWNVQSISIVNNREFYSYPLRGGKEILIPDCETPAIASSSSKTGNENLVTEKTEKLQTKLYPNPVQSILNVELGSKGTSSKTILIFDVYGKKVINQRTMQNNIQIDVKRLLSGSYFITVTDENGKPIINAKFIKQ